MGKRKPETQKSAEAKNHGRPGPEEDAVWERLRARVEADAAALAAVRKEGAGWIDGLLAGEAAERRQRLDGEPELATAARVQAALEEARARGRRRKEAALPVLGLALDLANRLPKATTPAGLIDSLRLAVLLETAETWSRLRRWSEAAAFLAWSDELLEASPDDHARAQANRLRRRLVRRTAAAASEERAERHRRLEELSHPARFTENLPWRETFLARLTTRHYATVFRAFGAIVEEHLAEFLRYLPAEAEGFPVPDLRAAAADLRYLQGYLASRGRAELEDADLTADQLTQVQTAGWAALGLGPIVAGLEGALPPPQ